jgi:hypothetical protein
MQGNGLNSFLFSNAGQLQESFTAIFPAPAHFDSYRNPYRIHHCSNKGPAALQVQHQSTAFAIFYYFGSRAAHIDIYNISSQILHYLSCLGHPLRMGAKYLQAYRPFFPLGIGYGLSFILPVNKSHITYHFTASHSTGKGFGHDTIGLIRNPSHGGCYNTVF